ncbi:MAG TPA: undecaprenyl-diphosphate phosphatase [Pirellulales bacterium]
MTSQLHLLLLAVIQGIGEFLPISSSGHLLLANEVWKRAGGEPLTNLLGAEIVLHGGTLLSILVVYRRRIVGLLAEDRRMIGLLLLGTLPAVIVGLPLHEVSVLKEWLQNSFLAGCLLPCTGLLLLWSGRRPEGLTEYRQITPRQAWLIGMAQALAILPGISRSGATIVAGLGLGLRRDAAASFSFLLAIPAILGAVVLEAKDFALVGASMNEIVPLLGAAGVSFAVGIVALALLLRWLRQGRLQPMAWWCIVVGSAFIAWRLAGTPWPGS